MVTTWVYIMASGSRTIYVGFTRDLRRRIWEHKTHYRDGFTKQYNVTRLVYVAEFSRYGDGIAHERALKGKTRAKKIALIEETNPRWNDLAWNWYSPEELATSESSSFEVEGIQAAHKPHSERQRRISRRSRCPEG